jgi:signal transduction histidine kinase
VDRYRPSLTEVAIAAASAAIGFAYARSDAQGSTAVAGGLMVAMGVLGVLTAADRPDREGLLRAAAACAVGVILGSWLNDLVRTSLLVLVFGVGRAVRMLQLERKAAGERAAAAMAEERAQIARDLHDVIAHSLGVVVVQMQAAELVMDSDPEKARAALQVAAGVGRDALDDMHRMVGVMRGLGDRRAAQPSLGDLPALVEQTRQTGLAVELHVDGDRRSAELPSGIEVAAYRIVQEALTNAARHAAGARADVRVAYRSDGLELEIIDSGGRSGAVAGGGFGIEGMRERASLYGGTLEAGPRPDGGFRVKAWLPAGRSSR